MREGRTTETLHANTTTLGCYTPDTKYDALILAIIRQAIEDYRESVRILRFRPWDIKAKTLYEEVCSFFRSDWFSVLSGITGEEFLSRLFPQGGGQEKMARGNMIKENERW